ncbi:MAG: isocitrate lyase/phosphoenolpyruvate mutase family protein [Ktedonobacteraceae bacterium]|nr:isocitrate lyase/phosphoenolpyruvate mutase family protein [Ktedonobacteraceae bacterium]
MTSQQTKAEHLLNMHQKGATLLLPNAWDAASARLFEKAGFPAIGTTSAGIAFVHGARDGEQMSRQDMVNAIARIVASVQVPVTADIEAGYGSTPEEVARTIRAVMAVGAVGVNLEDSTGPFKPLLALQEQCERIAAACFEARKAEIALFINARIDTYLFQIGEEAKRLEETLSRARAYLEAGANGIFVPGVIDLSLIEVLVREIPGPLNLIVMPGIPSAPDLFQLGVVRLSIGGAAMLAAMGLIWEIAHELREQGTYQKLSQHPDGMSQAWSLFA